MIPVTKETTGMDKIPTNRNDFIKWLAQVTAELLKQEIATATSSGKISGKVTIGR